MARANVPHKGGVYRMDPNSVAGNEMKDRHPFLVITPRQINALCVNMEVPITAGGVLVCNAGLTVTFMGRDKTGVAVCYQVRSFDIAARVRAETARFIETSDDATVNEIIARVVSAIDPSD